MASIEDGLLEREHEQRALHDLLVAATEGRGAAIVVEGAAGVGKSALLRRLGADARARGVRVLTAVGGELEREYPFGMVRQLLEPELRAADPARRAALLSGASALAARVVATAPSDLDAGQDSSFATLHGLYWLVVALSDEQPTLLVLDDAHWADAASLRFVDFLVRRVAELGVLVALGVRPREPGAEQALIDAVADADPAVVIRPIALSPAAVDDLVAAHLGAAAAADVGPAAHAATGGNPLLLLELLTALRAQPGPLTAADVSAVVPSSVTRSVLRRLERLTPEARDVAHALATLGDRDGEEAVALATGLSPTAVQAALQTLRAADLVAADHARFRHPLVRQAVADAVPVAARHALHAAAARALFQRHGGSEAVIVHLLARPPLHEAWAADVLRDGARRALAEGAPDSAARRLERAIAELDGPPPAELLLELGQAGLRAGDMTALTHLAAAAQADDPIVAARAMHALVAVETLVDAIDGPAITTRLRAALDRLGPDAPLALVDALTGAVLSAATLDRRLFAERRALLGRPQPRALPVLTGLAAYEGACADMPRQEVVERSLRCIEAAPYSALSQVESAHGWWPLGALQLVDEIDAVSATLAVAERTSARHGSRLGRCFVLSVRSHVALVFGSVTLAETAAIEAAELWREIGMEVPARTAVAQLIGALVRRGRIDEAEALMAAHEEPDEPAYPRGLTLVIRAQLRVAQRRFDDAIRDLREVQALADGMGFRRFGWGFPAIDLALALAAAGQAEEARSLAREELAVARRADRPSLELGALIALGLAAGGGAEQLDHLAAAVAVGPRARSGLLQATARVELGAALRRTGERTEARRRLREGHELAARTGAAALEQRALDELVVAGGRPRSRFVSGVEALTPSERRVADHAARGLSNREIAETLFVTRKTVELHLGRAYGKLGIRSRAQLETALRPAGDEPAPG